jgi:hypothetical protein
LFAIEAESLKLIKGYKVSWSHTAIEIGDCDSGIIAVKEQGSVTTSSKLDGTAS